MIWKRYVATMAKQELCPSNHKDIIDASTLEGELSMPMVNDYNVFNISVLYGQDPLMFWP